MVKPIQKDIVTSHFSRATLYALMANCLQFNKEVQENPGNSGTSKTRAMACELLAMRLLKEYSTRELIDALSYDFYPLQGLHSPGSTTQVPTPNWEGPQLTKQQSRTARISTLEIAIRAQAKRFLAHPLVVQQLEAIWAGSIVFHSAADNAHRYPMKTVPNQNRGYGAIESRGQPVLLAAQEQLQPPKQRDHHQPVSVVVRRTVTLYDPKDASLFKLSRLRVPRYRSALSTCSLAILLGLFVAVLKERSTTITGLEIIFWFWSAGFMLDEVVGFNEQGFSLYILSFWNSFDLGILIILFCYYCLRIYGILLVDDGKRQAAIWAYDVLAINAVLLFPRLFSVLDHYRYFSQLLIAFRMMAMDLMAILVLILISCSGFFVALTLSFGNNDFDGRSVAYALFQMIMGYTPAAWDQWDNYNFLGKGTMVLFLFIAHFLVITILITVLTNSFLAIVQNANDEHQFLFAVNTISMVKSDALFSYIAPTNILAWLLTPLRFCIPFRRFVRINRTVIKVSHFPVLFVIYVYERMFLKRSIYEPMDLIEQRGRQGPLAHTMDPAGTLSIFSPQNRRIREHSVATFHKDRALEEVFRRPISDNFSKDFARNMQAHTPRNLRNTQRSHERRKTSNVVNNWMQNIGPDGTASPPDEQDRSIVDRLERPRPRIRRSNPKREGGRDLSAAAMSVVSDPEEFISSTINRRPYHFNNNSDLMDISFRDSPQHAEDDGDDEAATNDENGPESGTIGQGDQSSDKENQGDYFQPRPPVDSRLHQPPPSASRTPEDRSISFDFPDSGPPTRIGPAKPKRARHERNLSTSTILYNPVPKTDASGSTISRNVVTARNSAKNSAKNTAPSSVVMTSGSPVGRKTPKRPLGATKPRPIMPDRTNFKSAPNLAGLLMLDTNPRGKREGRPFAMDLISDLGDNKAVGGGFLGAMPASFATQMGFGSTRALEGGNNEDQRRMGKLMLARMNTLELGFKEVLREVKDWRKVGGEDGKVGLPRKREKEGKSSKSLGKRREAEVWVDEEEGGIGAGANAGARMGIGSSI